jgi:L-amino acid N-acyltransferase YncA
MMRLRRATQEDVEFVYQCNNHPSTRAVSRQSQPFSLDEHTRWFTARLHDHQCELFVIEGDDAARAGALRIQHTKDSLEISLSLLPELRAKGLGAQSILAACEGRSLPVDAWIWEQNEASRRCFSRCGFSLTPQREVCGEKIFLLYQKLPSRLY